MNEEALDDAALCARPARGVKPEARDALGEFHGRHAQAVLAFVRRTGSGSALLRVLPAARLLRRHLLSRPSTQPPLPRPRLLTLLLAWLLLALSVQRLWPPAPPSCARLGRRRSSWWRPGWRAWPPSKRVPCWVLCATASTSGRWTSRRKGALGCMLLAPAYGVALAYFFYAPLARAHEEREGLEEVG